VVNGSKTFITSGTRADFITAAVRTGGPSHGGVSLLVIERDTPLHEYAQGTWGPVEADKLAEDVGGWHNPEA